MEIQEQLKNATILIAQLNEENEKLKKQIVDTELELSIYKKRYNDTLDKADKLVNTCNKIITEYNEIIKYLREAKNEYDVSIKEIYRIKSKYKNECEKIINDLG